MAFSASSARDLLRQFARNAGDSTAYDNTSIDNAVKAIGYRFVRNTTVTRTKSTMALTSGSAALPSFPVSPVGFRPEYVLDAFIDTTGGGPVELVDWSWLAQQRMAATLSGIPTLVAFDTYSTGEVYPKPDQNLSLVVYWKEPFISSSFNIPDEMAFEMLIYGGSAFLQHAEPEHRYASESWKKYLEFEASCRGVGGLGARSRQRTPNPDPTSATRTSWGGTM